MAKSSPPPTRILRFLGRVYAPRQLGDGGVEIGPNDCLRTPPIDGVWFVGDRPALFPSHTKLFGEKEFTPEFCRRYGRQCWQLNNGEHCADGEACTCWAELFAAQWNFNSDKQPWFELIEIPAPMQPTKVNHTRAGARSARTRPPAEKE